MVENMVNVLLTIKFHIKSKPFKSNTQVQPKFASTSRGKQNLPLEVKFPQSYDIIDNKKTQLE